MPKPALPSLSRLWHSVSSHRLRSSPYSAGARVPSMLVVPPRLEIRAHPVETPRLMLTPVESIDASELWLAVDGSREHLGQWLPWGPFNSDPAANQRFTDACTADWGAGRAVRFTVRERASRTLVGIVGLEACVHLHRSCELGYCLRKEATGRGLMTEAPRPALDFPFHPTR